MVALLATRLMSPLAMLPDPCRRIFIAFHRDLVLLELLRRWNSLRLW
jgi:hypothetical protein